MAFDEALINGDAELAAALWRNVFGAAWGEGMGGVTGSAAPPSSLVSESVLSSEQIIERETNFAIVLENLCVWFRKETHRLDSLSDEQVIYALADNQAGEGSTVSWNQPGPEPETEGEQVREADDLLEKGSDGKDQFERATEKGPDSTKQEDLNQPAVWS